MPCTPFFSALSLFCSGLVRRNETLTPTLGQAKQIEAIQAIQATIMTDSIEHLIIEQFRALRNQIETMQTEMRNEFGDVKHRISRLEAGIAGIRRDEAGTAEDIARQQLTLDRIKERLDRVERRLELTPGPTA